VIVKLVESVCGCFRAALLRGDDAPAHAGKPPGGRFPSGWPLRESRGAELADLSDGHCVLSRWGSAGPSLEHGIPSGV